MILDWYRKWAQYSPDKVAIKEKLSGRSISYAELNRKAEAWSQYLLGTGLQKGDRLAVLSEFNLEYFVLLGVAQKTGIILVPLNYRLSQVELNYMLKDSGCKQLLIDEKFQSQFSDWSIAPLALGGLDRLVQGYKAVHLDYSAPAEDDPLFILYTSGTTGFPKGAIYTHKMAHWNSINTALRLEVSAKDKCLQVMPPFHTGGWNVLATPLLHFGGSLVIVPSFDPEECLRSLSEESISLFMAVPTMVRMMSEAKNFEAADLSKLRYFIVGGEALALSQIEKWGKKGVPIRQGYGLTEVGPNVTSLNGEDALRKRGSIGFVNFHFDWKLVTKDGGEAKPNEQGELWLKGPCVTPGYWNNSKATAKAKEGPWFKTGDVLIQDDEGYLYLVDRLKNMYISGGENIYPSEIEKRLAQHPLVVEVAVKGVPDPKWGEVGCAFVVLKEEVSIPQLKAFCEEGLARFKVPKHWCFMSELPKGSSGKIDRKQLIFS